MFVDEVGVVFSSAPVGVRKRISRRTEPSSPITVLVMCTVPPSGVAKEEVWTLGPSRRSSKMFPVAAGLLPAERLFPDPPRE